jgi:hypothetical protein
MRPPNCSPLCPPYLNNAARLGHPPPSPIHTLVGNRCHIMHAQASSQAMPMAPASPAGDTIPFGTALALSSVAVAAAIGQIRGCFLPGELRPWQLTICCIFLASSASVFGAMVSRFHGTRNLLCPLVLELTI